MASEPDRYSPIRSSWITDCIVESISPRIFLTDFDVFLGNLRLKKLPSKVR
jgi:hypothetical protein